MTYLKPSNFTFQIITSVSIHSLLFLVVFVLCIHDVYGQSRDELEQKKARLTQDIGLTSNLLDKTNKDKAAAFDRFEMLKTNINQREDLIQTLDQEITLEEERIFRNEDVIESLQRDLGALKTEYSKIMQMAFRYKMNNSNLMLLISSRNFNQAFRRWRYLKQYDEYRKRQVELIAITKDMLEKKVVNIAEIREEKELLSLEMKGEKIGLDERLSEANTLVRALNADEVYLRKELVKKKKSKQSLDNAIAEVIRKEMEKARNATKNSVGLPNTPGANRLSNNFKNNRGKLPWPVDKGVISKFFGNQKHPTLKSILIKNNGVDILTHQGSDIRSVFEGKVTGIQFIPGYSNVVIIQHGKYYTVYSNLDKISVQRGQQLNTRQKVGTVRTDLKSGKAELHFEIWDEKTRLNPSKWLAKK